MTLYDAIADLPIEIEDVSLSRRERDTSSGFARVTTVISLAGNGEVGKGEDVAYEAEDHDALLDAGAPDLAGEYTFSGFSNYVGELDLFPEGPTRPDFREYRRWGIESAALDLALRQSETDLPSALETSYDPVRFVVSTRLGEPPTLERIEQFLEYDPGTEFKLDPTSEWTDELIERLAETGAVRALDLKGQYEGTVVDQAPDPELYERVIEGLPETVIEDPALTEDTRPTLDGHEERVAWDATIHGVTDIEALPWEPSWINIKPSRFGSIESLFETIEYCEERGIAMYGGGQFELDVGRGQIQALASIFYPDAANDVAPGGYNDPEIPENLSNSPLSPPESSVGFRW
jgi:hypothetical protein